MKVLERFTDYGTEELAGYHFWCPGCECLHGVWVERPNSRGAKWGFNGNEESPTFTPSILVQWDEYVPSAADPEVRKKIEQGEITQTKVHRVCHSFVTNSMIQFLSDCTHGLAGQTVPLPNYPE